MSQQINLYHPIFRKQEKKFSARSMLQAGGAILLGTALLYGYVVWQMSSLRAEASKATAQHNIATQRLQEVTQKFSARPKSQRLQHEVDELERKVNAMTKVKAILHSGAFGNTTGYSDYMAAFARQHIKGLWLTGFVITGSGNEMSIEGRTVIPELVPKYMQKLAVEDRLAGAEFDVFWIKRPETQGTTTSPPYLEFLVKTERSKDKE